MPLLRLCYSATRCGTIGTNGTDRIASEPRQRGIPDQSRRDGDCGGKVALDHRSHSRGRPRAGAQTPHRARQIAGARSGQGTPRSRHALPRAVDARRPRSLRRRGARREHRHRHRQGFWPRGGSRRQRRDGQRRHVLSDHREEASARPGDRDGKPSPVRLPGRFRRRVPADAVRSFPRPRTLWPHLLQHGADVGDGNRAGCRGDGFMHGRGRLRSRDVR